MQLTVVGRSCGECTACCTTCGVVELGKPMNMPCIHQQGGGCAIYGNHPATCREFTCAWLAGDLPEKYRPDRCGVVFWSIDPKTIGASLTGADVPVDRVAYLAGKLAAARPTTVNGRPVTYKDRAILIIPPTVRLPAGGRVVKHQPLGNNMFLVHLSR